MAVSDFSEDPTGAFSLQTHQDADIVVFDRNTLAKTVRDLPSKQAFPMLGSASRLGYLDWGAVNRRVHRGRRPIRCPMDLSQASTSTLNG